MIPPNVLNVLRSVPLHPELVSLLPGWLASKKSAEKLFPRLDRKKTWLMVKLDLKRVGIPYETEEGIADFHASGRHSYVTGLLRNGATLTEAKELARHSDVRMTMRYTHIGLNDQAKALASLPGPRSKPATLADQNSASTENASQQSSQQLNGPKGQTETRRGTSRHRSKKNPEASSTVANGTYDASGQSVAEPGTDSAKWRRRELNPPLICRNALQRKELQQGDFGWSAYVSQSGGSEEHNLTHNDASLAWIADAWPHLPPHIRETILTLIDAANPGNSRIERVSP